MILRGAWLTRIDTFVLLIIICGGFVCGGCGSNNGSVDSKNNMDSGAPVRSEVERGPVKFTVEVSPGKPRLSDEPQLTLTIRALNGIRVQKVPFGEALGEFLIRDFHEPVPESDGDWQILRQIYTLEATHAGVLTVSPITVHFTDARQEGDGKQHSIESEAIPIEVSTLLAEEAPSLVDLQPAIGPVELPASAIASSWWIVGIVVVIAIAAAFAWQRVRRSSVSDPQLSPQELAWLELEQIVEHNLAESDSKAFYVELTGVVRRYIERSTGVRAPELTTEEFLREIAGKETIAPNEQQRLRDFLEAADLVKFAGYEPQTTDIEQSFERAKRFIGLPSGNPQEAAA